VEKGDNVAGKNHKRYKLRKRMNAIKHEPIRLFKEPPTLISTWKELGKAYSETHYIELDKDGWCGHVRPKFAVANDDEYFSNNIYLSTHTFYGSSYYYMTTLLRKLGFNIQLANWDGETIYAVN
jgi:hypothetical protein